MTKQDQHTPEPWLQTGVRLTAKPLIPFAGQIPGLSSVIVNCHSTDLHPDEDLANARRIVACVNACAGIPNSVLAVFTQPECNILASNGLANQQLQQVTAQRDELLAALKLYADDKNWFNDLSLIGREPAKDAITKATGSTPA